MRFLAALLVCCGLLLLGSFRVSVPYIPPAPPAPAANSPADQYKEIAGWKTAQPAEGALRGNWWEIFDDPQLNALEKQVEVSNQELKAAEARFARPGP